MEERNNVLYLPFDESNGVTTTSDYSQSRTNAILTNCSFVDGKQGKAIEFDGNGHADISNGHINLSSNFTVLAWINTTAPEIGNDNKLGIYLQYGNGVGDYMQKWYDNGTGVWTYWAIVKEGLSIKVYKDTQVIDTITLTANLIGMALNQAIYATDYGFAKLDDVKIYNVAATQDEVAEVLNSVKQLTYYINGLSLIPTWGIHIQSSDGILQRPKMKTPLKQDWADLHGEVVDLANKRFQSREITLKCWMPANGKIDFVNKWNDFISQFEGDDTVRLMIDIHPTKPLVYEVYLEDALDVSKKWNDELMVGTFTLKLKEPDPVKKVVRFRADGETTHYIKVKSDTMLTIAWGDGTFTHNVWGDHTTEATKLSHTYSTQQNVYYAIISGVIEDIDDFETDGIIVWDKF